MKKTLQKTTILLGIFLFLGVVRVSAQSTAISLSPKSPEEGESFVITVSSFLADLENSLITWTSDGEVLGQGVGKKTLAVDSAKNEIIVVEIQDRTSGETIRQRIPIIPSSIDILWESVGSYTPAFYKGKALPTLESTINVVAVPDRSDRSSLYYLWSKEFSSQPGQSGRGVNSFSYVGTALELSNTVSVEVTGSQNGYFAQKNSVIQYRNSEVVFYEEDESLGTLFNKALKNGHNLDGNKISLTAIPYFVGVEDISSDNLTIDWAVNGINTAIPSQKNKMRFVAPQGTTGEVVVSVFIKNITRLFEEGEVGIKFDL